MMIKNLSRIAALVLLTGLVAFFMGCALLGSKSTSDDVIFWDTSLLSNVTRITNDGELKSIARISPDGTKLLYLELTKPAFSTNIVLLRNPTVANKTVLVSGMNIFQPGWSDNSTNYYYVAIEDNSSRLIRSSVTGVGKTYVTRSEIGRSDSWPTGRGSLIACNTLQGDKSQIVTLRDNGTEVTFLGEGFQPSWHPTEEKIIFARPVSANDALTAIYEMDIKSGQVTEIYRDSKRYNCVQPSYSSDGRYILFQKGAQVVTTGVNRSKTVVKTDKQSKWQIFIMNADGTGGLSALTGGLLDTTSPTMDADGWLYFIADLGKNKTEIYRARIIME